MCSVSVIYDYAHMHWPPDSWSQENWSRFKRIIDDAKELDAAHGEHDCVDPEKAAYADAVEAFLERVR